MEWQTDHFASLVCFQVGNIGQPFMEFIRYLASKNHTQPYRIQIDPLLASKTALLIANDDTERRFQDRLRQDHRLPIEARFSGNHTAWWKALANTTDTSNMLHYVLNNLRDMQIQEQALSSSSAAFMLTN